MKRAAEHEALDPAHDIKRLKPSKPDHLSHLSDELTLRVLSHLSPAQLCASQRSVLLRDSGGTQLNRRPDFPISSRDSPAMHHYGACNTFTDSCNQDPHGSQESETQRRAEYSSRLLLQSGLTTNILWRKAQRQIGRGSSRSGTIGVGGHAMWM